VVRSGHASGTISHTCNLRQGYESRRVLQLYMYIDVLHQSLTVHIAIGQSGGYL
jgi:hypothetical protein